MTELTDADRSAADQRTRKLIESMQRVIDTEIEGSRDAAIAIEPLALALARFAGRLLFEIPADERGFAMVQCLEAMLKTAGAQNINMHHVRTDKKFDA